MMGADTRISRSFPPFEVGSTTGLTEKTGVGALVPAWVVALGVLFMNFLSGGGSIPLW